MKIGILTGGGDCPGINEVLRAVVKTAVNEYGWEVIGFRDGFRGLVLNDFCRLAPADVMGILFRGGTILGSSNRDNPFRFRIEENGQVRYEDLSGQALRNAEAHGLACLLVVGGDGTLSCAFDFTKKGLRVIGIPKTIDNDLSGTDLTFGFMTAVDTATDALEKLHTTAESHHRIMVLEVMGRYAGWIALHSGIAGSADVILIPEISYNLDRVARRIQERKSKGKTFSIIVVAEGAHAENEEMAVSRRVEGSPDPVRLGGIGQRIATDLEKLTGNEARVTVLGHLQRGGKPSAFDRILATRYGVAAVHLAAQGEFNRMISLQGEAITSVPLTKEVTELRRVPSGGELVRAAKEIGIEFGN